MKLPLLTGKELLKVVMGMGFEAIRQESNHVFLRHPDGRTTVIPVHSGEEIDLGLLNKIVKKDLQITREEFLKYMR